MTRLLLAVWLLLSLAAAQELELHFIDVGQGDAVFIRAPGGQGVLYDGGRRTRAPLDYLLDLSVPQVDLVIASHADADHIAGLAAVVAHYRPRFFMDNGIPHTTQTYANLLETVAAAGSDLLEPTERRIALGDVVLQIIPPPGIPGYGNNNNSVGVIVEWGAFRAALTGDAEARQMTWWDEHVPHLLGPVQVYKASHHGSDNGDTPLTLERFQPQTVIIGVGEGNSFGHPSEGALALYRAAGAEVYRTDWHGTVVVRARADGHYVVTTERTPPAPSPPLEFPILRQRQAAPQAPTRLEIVCVLYAPDAGEEEAVSLRATGRVSSAGWYLGDERGRQFPLPAATLSADETLVLRGDDLWDAGGDTAFLYDPAGRLMDSLSFEGGGREVCR